MKYFGEYLSVFLAEAKVIKGSEFDTNKCVKHMAATDEIVDTLRDALVEGCGTYFSWQGELLTITNNAVITDTFDTKLSEYYALDLKNLLPDVNDKFKNEVRVFDEIAKLNTQLSYGDLLKDMPRDLFISDAVMHSLGGFLSEFTQAIRHGVHYPHPHTYHVNTSDVLKFGNIDTLTSNLNNPAAGMSLQEVGLIFLDKYNVDIINDRYYRMKGFVFLNRFCNKRNFKNFVKFTFTVADGRYTEDSDFKDAQESMVVALRHQGMKEHAKALEDIAVKSILNMDTSDSWGVCDGISLIRRKHSVEIRMDNHLAQQLNIFLLKYNKDRVNAIAA